MEFSYELRPGHLVLRASGAFDLQRARHALGELLRESQAREVFRILVDGRGITTPVSIADRYDLATQLAGSGAGKLRIAIVVAPENRFSKTLEDTARNRGVNLRTTDSMEEALRFLEIA